MNKRAMRSMRVIKLAPILVFGTALLVALIVGGAFAVQPKCK
jgi:hypothetical protein